MTHEFGGRRSPEAWSSPHDRARVRMAERMTEPLEPEESAWLDAHLVDCAACRDIDAAYHSDREYLRAMRVIPPPRDLWARTSTALDAEQARVGGGRRRSRPARRRAGGTVVAFPRGRWAPIGAVGSIAAVMVVGFLLGNMLIGTGPASTPGIAVAPTATPNLVPTAIPVPKSDVAWVSTTSDGSIVVRQAPVNDVCPADAPAGCAPFDRNASQVATLSVKPTSVHQSPTSGQMIVFGKTQSGTGVTMFVLNTGNTPPPTTRPTVAPTIPPTAPPATPPATTSTPGTSETPGTTGGASSPPTNAPGSPTAPATATPPPTASPTAKATATASIVPNVTPPPSAAALIAVATDLGVLNAETAAYSADGAWFAFTARKLDLAIGSDIYLWHAGDLQATQVTTDGRSVFAGWVGNRIAGSSADVPAGSDASPSAGSPSADAATDTGEFGTTSFLVDPATLDRTTIPTPAWRPAVDPGGKFVVYWDGTVALDPATGGWRSATGRLVIRSWPAISTAASGGASPSVLPAPPTVAPSPSASAGASAATSSAPGAKATPKPVGSPASSPSAASPSPSSSPSTLATPTPTLAPTATPPSGLPDGIASAGRVDWAVAWDENGTHLAVWIGDKADRTFGHLNLLTIGANGLPTAGGGVLTEEPALPGFSLADGHLAWATPVGPNGDGSTLKIYAYSGKDPGFGGPGAPAGSGTVVVVQH